MDTTGDGEIWRDIAPERSSLLWPTLHHLGGRGLGRLALALLALLALALVSSTYPLFSSILPNLARFKPRSRPLTAFLCRSRSL